MNVLLTGAFGNVGTSTLAQLLNQGHRVRCLDLKTKTNEKAARRIVDRAEVMWGDLRNPATWPPPCATRTWWFTWLSSSPSCRPPASSRKAARLGAGHQRRRHPERHRGYEGPAPPTQAGLCLVAARLWHDPGPAAAATVWTRCNRWSIMPAQGRVRADGPDLGLEWAILRFARPCPSPSSSTPACSTCRSPTGWSFVHTRDVGLAVANAAASPAVWGRLLLIGGGTRCQYYYREIVERVLAAAGVGMLPEAALPPRPLPPTGWTRPKASGCFTTKSAIWGLHPGEWSPRSATADLAAPSGLWSVIRWSGSRPTSPGPGTGSGSVARPPDDLIPPQPKQRPQAGCRQPLFQRFKLEWGSGQRQVEQMRVGRGAAAR